MIILAFIYPFLSLNEINLFIFIINFNNQLMGAGEAPQRIDGILYIKNYWIILIL